MISISNLLASSLFQSPVILYFPLLSSVLVALNTWPSQQWWTLGACRELAPSKQESTTYEPSLVCKLLILSCRLLIPDRLLASISIVEKFMVFSLVQASTKLPVPNLFLCLIGAVFRTVGQDIGHDSSFSNFSSSRIRSSTYHHSAHMLSVDSIPRIKTSFRRGWYPKCSTPGVRSCCFQVL